MNCEEEKEKYMLFVPQEILAKFMVTEVVGILLCDLLGHSAGHVAKLIVLLACEIAQAALQLLCPALPRCPHNDAFVGPP